MSGDPIKKRKDKKKKKAMLEALQQEEYRDERTNISFVEDPEELVFQAAYSGDEVPLVDNDGSGSGCLTKFTFLLLVTLLVAGAGIAFYEVDVLDIKEQILGLVGVEPIDAESPIIDILAEDAEPAFTAADVEDLVPENETIDPSPIVTEPEPEEVEPVAEPEPEVAEPAAEPEPVEAEPAAEPEPEAVEVTEESSFESELEDEPTEVPQESFTMRAEREAVQAAVDQVWVLTVRCVEELRGLQTIAQSQLTLETVDRIRIRLEPLREELDDLVKNASESVLDGALEQAAQLERNLRSVLDDLETARITENEVKQAVEEEEVVQEELVAEVEAEPTQSEEAVAEPEPEIVEPVVEAVAEPEPEAVEAVAEPEAVEAVAEPEPEVVEVAVAEPEPEVVEVAAAEPEEVAVAEPEAVEPEVVEAVAEPEAVEAAVVAEAEPEVVEQPEIEAIKEEEPVATPEVVKAIVDEVSQEDIETNEVPRTSVVEDVNHLVEEASPAA